VERVVACALAVEPAKRFANAGSFWAALRAAAGAPKGEMTAPILLTRRRWPTRRRRRGRPARRAVIALVSVLAVVAVLAAVRVIVPRMHLGLVLSVPALAR
jgi:hypothetical protein